MAQWGKGTGIRCRLKSREAEGWHRKGGLLLLDTCPCSQKRLLAQLGGLLVLASRPPAWPEAACGR